MGACLPKPERVVFPYLSPHKKSSLPRTRSASQSAAQVPKPGEVRLFGTRFCPFTYRVRIALECKGVPAHVFWLNEEDHNFGSKQLHAYMLLDGELAFLQHDDQTISGSSDVILDYVKARFPKPSLLSQAETFMEWVMFVRDKFSPLIFQAIYQADPLRRETTEAELHEAFKALDSAIGKNASEGPYFMGDQFSLVDVYLIPFLLLTKPLSYFHGININPSHAYLINYSKRMMSFSCVSPIKMDMDLLQMHVAMKLAHNRPPPLVLLTVLQHCSILNHLEKLVKAIDEILMDAKQTARIVDPLKGSIAMQIRKVATRYGSLLDFMLEHAQMEERVIFPALEKADRGITKVANESHARDLPVMNGIREDLKAVLALDQASAEKIEVLSTVSARLQALQEHMKDHFMEEEVDLLPLLNAAGLGSKEQAALVGQCVSIMESMHLHHFPVLLDGLRPHEIQQYLVLLHACFSDFCKDLSLKPSMKALKQADDYGTIFRVVQERLPTIAALA